MDNRMQKMPVEEITNKQQSSFSQHSKFWTFGISLPRLSHIRNIKRWISTHTVITDHFPKYAVAIPTRNQTAKTTAEAFYNNFVLQYGLPKRLHSDQGANFESKFIRELCDLTGIEKSKTTPYHPMGNGLTKRFNRTLLQMLGTLTIEQKQNWKKYVGPMVHAYNS